MCQQAIAHHTREASGEAAQRAMAPYMAPWNAQRRRVVQPYWLTTLVRIWYKQGNTAKIGHFTSSIQLMV
jgi:hypothetical protein